MPETAPVTVAVADSEGRSAPSDGKRPGAPASFWVASTYFAEGYPYMVVNGLADMLFSHYKASLQTIGLTALLHLPWNLKFLWGPFLDSYGTKRQWLVGVEALLSVLLLALALTTTLPSVLLAASLVLLVVAVASATHDIAVDGYYLEALDAKGQSRYVGYRAAAYRLAMLAISGPLTWVCGSVGWLPGLVLIAALMAAITAWHAFALPHAEVARRPILALGKLLLRGRVLALGASLAAALAGVRALLGSETAMAPLTALTAAAVEAAPWLAKLGVADWVGLSLLLAMLLLLGLAPMLRRRLAASQSDYGRAFVDFLGQDRVGRVLAFVVLFRTGESFLMKMKFPFFKQAGLDVAEYGLANGTIGILASFAGTMVGGWLISRDGLRRWLWPFVLSQNVLNLLFAGVAFGQDGGMTFGFASLTAIIAAEHFGAGLGTAVFMVYLMRCCLPTHKAAHMAILTALMSVSFTFAGASSGYLASAMGFGWYFAFTFVATVPAMLLIPGLPHLDAAPVHPKDAPAAA